MVIYLLGYYSFKETRVFLREIFENMKKKKDNVRWVARPYNACMKLCHVREIHANSLHYCYLMNSAT